ncbi:hypothetical protein C2G38_1102037 [Gigaspora rosea]|uniref:Uncharacterized protein n=1 Tax=Gigaspora rosea TaxID=44941 RepID=A0A397VJB7_9GLOM|nr:hypothetical protein C2G38_1102037 [Gigaspora rosea]
MQFFILCIIVRIIADDPAGAAVTYAGIFQAKNKLQQTREILYVSRYVFIKRSVFRTITKKAKYAFILKICNYDGELGLIIILITVCFICLYVLKFKAFLFISFRLFKNLCY